MTIGNSQFSELELRSYLFGEVSDATRAEIEDTLLIDDELFFNLVNLENQIIDHYIRGKLSEDDLIRFEKSLEKFPERKAKIANAIALQTLVADERTVEIKSNKKKDKDEFRLFNFLEPLISRFEALSPLVLGLSALFLLILIPFVLYLSKTDKMEISQVTNSGKPLINSHNTSSNNSIQSNQMPQMTITPVYSANNQTSNSTISSTLLAVEDSVTNTIEISNDTKHLFLTLILPTTIQKTDEYSVRFNEQDLPGKFKIQKNNKGRKIINVNIIVAEINHQRNKISVVDSSGKKITDYFFETQIKH